MSQKSILEQALLQVQTLEEAVKANAKGILASTMKQELNDLLKESMEEEDEDVNEQPDSEEETQDDVPAEAGDDEESVNNDESDEESSDDEELLKNIDSLDSEDDVEMPDMGMNMDSEGEDEEDVVDMTDADEDEILKVFKAMSPEDGIIVKKDENHIELSDGDDEYIIKLGKEDEMESFDMNEEESFEMDEDDDDESLEVEEDDDDDVVYEIELDEMMDDEEDFGERPKWRNTPNLKYANSSERLAARRAHIPVFNKGGDATKNWAAEKKDQKQYAGKTDVYKIDAYGLEGDVDEAARTKWNIHGDKAGMDRAGIKGKKVFAAGAINEEVATLKKQNAEYKKALILFKEKLNEVATFNANLAYATRLFTEHSTTKQEKLNILKRFDSISTLKESKNLYSTLKSELEIKKPISESVVEKITSAPSTSSSTQVLSESKAYENPQFKRMKDLMSKIK
jgi:hypothetical protein